MTLEEFFESLRETIRSRGDNVVKTRHAYLIRVDGKLYCPLTYLCGTTTGKWYPSSKYDWAGTKLGLSHDDFGCVAVASYLYGPAKLRRKLKKALGIEKGE